MGLEEQKEEREVLDSIFPDEITDISDTEYRISILLDVINDDGDDSEPPSMVLHVKYPENYPDEAPILDLTTPPNATPHPHLSISEDKMELLAGLDETISENLGMAMIFTLVSTLKDAAEQLVASRQGAVREEQEQRILAAEREENKKFNGEPVTADSFKEWRKNFRREMDELRVRDEEVEEAAERKRNRGKDAIERLTGKQLWERGMVGKVDEDAEEDMGEDALAGGIGKLKVEA